MEARPKKIVAVVICGRTWGEADQKIRDWIKAHPHERILERIPPVLTTSYDKMCGALIVESDKESLPSDFGSC
jgi:hypothetical protein